MTASSGDPGEARLPAPRAWHEIIPAALVHRQLTVDDTARQPDQLGEWQPIDAGAAGRAASDLGRAIAERVRLARML